MSKAKKCPDCDGKGYVSWRGTRWTCGRCNGTGVIAVEDKKDEK